MTQSRQMRFNIKWWISRISKVKTLMILCLQNLPLKNAFCSTNCTENRDPLLPRNQSKDRHISSDLRGVWCRLELLRAPTNQEKSDPDFKTWEATQIWARNTLSCIIRIRPIIVQFLLEEAQPSNLNLNTNKITTKKTSMGVISLVSTIVCQWNRQDLFLSREETVYSTCEVSRIKMRSNLSITLIPIAICK